MRYLVAVMFVSVAVGIAQGQRCVAPSEKSNDSTRSGGNLVITMIERRGISKLRGQIILPDGMPSAFTLLEIYDNPGWLREKPGAGHASQTRVIGCESDEHGRFEISGLKKGEYELRISAGSPFNVTHVFITINPNARGRTLKYTLELGT